LFEEKRRSDGRGRLGATRVRCSTVEVRFVDATLEAALQLGCMRIALNRS
jgi:hypothetical protein